MPSLFAHLLFAVFHGAFASDAGPQRERAGWLEAAFERYQVPLLTFLTHLLNDRADAEDAFVETWARIAQRAETYEERGSFQAYLFQVAKREAFRLLGRRVDRDSRDALTWDGDVPEPTWLDAPASDPASEVERVRTARRLENELTGLSSELRLCFLLFHSEGLTVLEVAAATGLSPATVKRRIGAARRLLARRLADLAPGPGPGPGPGEAVDDV